MFISDYGNVTNGIAVLNSKSLYDFLNHKLEPRDRVFTSKELFNVLRALKGFEPYKKMYGVKDTFCFVPVVWNDTNNNKM